MALAAHLVRRYRASPGAPTEPGKGLSRRQFARVTEHVEEHLDQRLSLAELAAVAGVSVTQFKTLFKGSTGLPVHRYVIRRRVARARVLLREGAASITGVALQTGFPDPSHPAADIAEVAARPVVAHALERALWARALASGGLGEGHARLVIALQYAHNAGHLDVEPGASDVRRGPTDLFDALRR